MSANTVTALADVRRAYRLLWAYQRRVMKYNQWIRDRLGFQKYNVEYLFNRPGGDLESRWSWDSLPFSSIGFESVRCVADPDTYERKEWMNYPKAGDALLYVEVVSDSAIKDASWSKEPDPLRFAPVEECRTELKVWLVVNRIDRSSITNWHHTLVKEAPEWPKQGEVVNDARGIDIYCDIIDLSAVDNQESLDRWIDEFAKAVEEKLDYIATPTRR